MSLPDEIDFVQIRESDSIGVVYRTPSLRTPGTNQEKKPSKIISLPSSIKDGDFKPSPYLFL
jgi:hypothetical protein